MRGRLTHPNREYEQSYREYILELGDEERYPFPLDWDYEDFDLLLRKLGDFRNGKNIPEGFVPSTTYWLVEDGDILGVSNLRHYLNDRIRKVGGHIGLGIRPSRRGEGLGRELLQLTIEKGRELGLGDLHIHCHKENQSSVNMIRASGAELESEVPEKPGGPIVQRYVHVAS
jgi:predicted acetyltransferase